MSVRKILIIEDATIVREPLTRLLKSEGFEALQAGDGHEAMAIIETHEVDLILLDVLMPRMDGVRFLEALRANPRFRGTPVIAMTGISDTSRLMRLRELGVGTILHKVRFTFEGLLTEIRQHLSDSAASAV